MAITLKVIVNSMSNHSPLVQSQCALLEENERIWYDCKGKLQLTLTEWGCGRQNRNVKH